MDRLYSLLPFSDVVTSSGGDEAFEELLQALRVGRREAAEEDGDPDLGRLGRLEELSAGPDPPVRAVDLRSDAGRVSIGGVDVSGAPPHRRSRLGLARTFQQPIVFRGLNGAENVMAGHANDRPNPLSAMFSLPSSMAKPFDS